MISRNAEIELIKVLREIKDLLLEQTKALNDIRRGLEPCDCPRGFRHASCDNPRHYQGIFEVGFDFKT